MFGALQEPSSPPAVPGAGKPQASLACPDQAARYGIRHRR